MSFWAGLRSLAHLLPAQPTKLNRAADTELELPANTASQYLQDPQGQPERLTQPGVRAQDFPRNALSS